MQYIIREEPLIEEMNGKSMEEVLKKDYTYLYDSMVVEDYQLRFDDCDYFKEIVFEDKVVGFLTYEEFAASYIILKDAFIIPEFRGKKLFFLDFSIFLMSGLTIAIAQPTRDMVEMLIDVGFACKLTDNLVASAIPFDIPYDMLLPYGELKDQEPLSYLYDLEICSTIFLNDISTPGVCKISYHEVLREDEKKYDAGEIRKSIKIRKHFKNIKRVFLKNSDKFNAKLFELKENLPKPIFDYEVVIGEGDELSQHMQGLVDEGFLSEEKALNIKKRLKKEYECGDVREDGLNTRLAYLVNDVDLSKDKELFLENLSQTLFLCPDCYQPISLSDTYCGTCGFNISGGKTLNYDEALKEFSKVDDGATIVDLRGNKLDEFLNQFDDSDYEEDSDDDSFFSMDADETEDQLIEIYNSRDVDAFNDFCDEYDLDWDSIDYIADLNTKQEIDVGGYSYAKNYLHTPYVIKRREYENYSLRENNKPIYYSYDLYHIMKGLKDNPKIDEVAGDLELYHNPNEVKAILFSRDYIESKNYGEDIYDVFLDNNTVADFKKILRENNLKVSGNKVDLASRIVNNGLFTLIGDDEYVLTDEGSEVLSKMHWVNFCHIAMEEFDFLDFENYMVDLNINMFPVACEKYLNEFLQKAYKNRDFDLLFNATASKAMLHVYVGDYKDALIEELKLFMIKLNPIYLTPEKRRSSEPISHDNISNIDLLSNLCGIYNIKKVFSKTWSSMKFDKRLMTKKITLNYLNRAINGENLQVLSEEIIDIYF